MTTFETFGWKAEADAMLVRLYAEEATRKAAAEAATRYLDPYNQAVGEFLEYVCGRPLPNPLTGDTV